MLLLLSMLLLGVFLLRLLSVLLLRLLSVLLWMTTLRLSCILFMLCEGRHTGSERQKQGRYSESCKDFHGYYPN